MKKNESGLDRIVRVAIGVTLITLYASGATTGWLAYLLLLLGGFLTITGAVGFSPLYALIKHLAKK
ncbi:MAG: DUF2892 domain-containing protein [Anaerolineae bacterium]|nr:DUF2892 domain-containing protein [Anaerolineae bacterium]